MPRRARRLLLCLAATASLAVAGCGNKEDFVTIGETEGIYVTVDGLKYQVQISRILNPTNAEDQGYLRGLAPGEEPDADQVWFAIFMRVENDSDEVHTSAAEFEILDTQENTFEPVELDEEVNVFSYRQQELPPETITPVPGSPAYDNTIRGNLLLFEVDNGSLYNRPLELKIVGENGDEGIIDLDV